MSLCLVSSGILPRNAITQLLQQTPELTPFNTQPESTVFYIEPNDNSLSCMHSVRNITCKSYQQKT